MAMIGVFGASFCSTEAIVAEVSQRLGYPVVGDALIEEAARYRGMSAERFARVFAGPRGLLDIVTHAWDKSVICVNAALARMLNMDQQICCGPATHLIPEAITHMLRVGITATDDYRMAQAVREKNCKDREAARLIKNDDEGISSWTRRLFNKDPWDRTLYDIQLALPDVSVTGAAEIICAKAQRSAVRPTDRSIQAVVNFQLAARVNMALLEGGYPNCGVSADRGDLSVVIRQGTPRGALARTVRALRYDRIDAEVRRIALTFEEVKGIAVRPGRSFKRRPRTLLVDDDQEYVETLSERLDLRDIVTEVVHDGGQALTAVKTGLPDVMVLDLEMPGIHGLDVLRRIKQDHPQVEVIIVTGHGSEDDAAAARELGAYNYMTKPVDIGVLAAKIKQAARQVHLNRNEEEVERGQEDA